MAGGLALQGGVQGVEDRRVVQRVAAQQAAQVHGVLVAQAQQQAAFGGEAQAVAGGAEVVRVRRDEADARARVLRQAHVARRAAAVFGAVQQFEALGADLCEGVYFGAQYWHGVDAPLNKELVAKTQEKFGINPNYSLAGSYLLTKLLIDAAAKAGSVEGPAVAEVLRGQKYAGLTGEEEIRAADHQVIKDYYLLKGKAKADMADKDDYAEVVTSGKSFLSAEAAGCKMG